MNVKLDTVFATNTKANYDAIKNAVLTLTEKTANPDAITIKDYYAGSIVVDADIEADSQAEAKKM